MANKKVFECKIECQSCGGTGLYVGMAERDGAAVVCSHCKGTGCYNHKFTYISFTERVRRDDVRRVFKTSCGFVHTPEDIVFEGEDIKFSQSGASYEEWLIGKSPLPMKTLYCPKLWTGQKWDSEKCKKHCRLSDSIYNCPMLGKMAECWDEYENANQ